MASFGDLFLLIKSLSKSEKRYFRLNSFSQSGNPKYVQLFDLLGDMEELDKSGISVLYEEGTNQQQVSATKNYLYDLILESLRSFHEKKSIDYELNNLYTNALVLEKRGLYGQALKLLKRAKKMAQKHEKHSMLVEIIRRQLFLEEHDSKNKNIRKDLERLHDELDAVLDKIYDEYRVFNLTHKIFTFRMQKSKVENEEEKAYMESILSHPLMEEAAPPDSFVGKLYYYHGHGLAKLMLFRDFKKANYYYELALKTWDEYPEIKSENPKLYKNYISNFLNTCHINKRYDRFPKLLNVLESLPAKSIDQKAKDFVLISSLKLLYYLNTSKYKQAESLAPEILDGLNKFENNIEDSIKITFLYNITLLFFALEDHDQALDWVNRILNSTAAESRQDIQLIARILNLVFHYELGNDTILEYLYNSTYRGLKKVEKLDAFEKIVLQNLKKIQNLPPGKPLTDGFIHFQSGLEKLVQQYPGKKPIGMEEMLIWVDSKVSKRSFIEVMEARK